jgi:hypothetical protein
MSTAAREPLVVSIAEPGLRVIQEREVPYRTALTSRKSCFRKLQRLREYGDNRRSLDSLFAVREAVPSRSASDDEEKHDSSVALTRLDGREERANGHILAQLE